MPAEPRHRTLDRRAVMIYAAIQQLADAEVDWPTYINGHDQLVEALGLLRSILAHLEAGL